MGWKKGKSDTGERGKNCIEYLYNGVSFDCEISWWYPTLVMRMLRQSPTRFLKIG